MFRPSILKHFDLVVANFSSSCSLHYAPIWKGFWQHILLQQQHPALLGWAGLVLECFCLLICILLFLCTTSAGCSVHVHLIQSFVYSGTWYQTGTWWTVTSINSGLPADFCALCCRCNLICEPCSLLLTYLCWETVSQLTCNYPGPAQNVPSFLCRQCFGWLTANHFTGTRIRTKEILF